MIDDFHVLLVTHINSAILVFLSDYGTIFTFWDYQRMLSNIEMTPATMRMYAL